MSSYRRLAYRPSDTFKTKFRYSTQSAPGLTVPYEIKIKGRDEVLVLYLGSMKSHNQATEAAMKEVPGGIVTEVKVRREGQPERIAPKGVRTA